jgi:hypothetical protein
MSLASGSRDGPGGGPQYYTYVTVKDSLVGGLCMDVMSVVLSGHSTGVVIGFSKRLGANCETVGDKRAVVKGIAECLVRPVVPRKRHVEHANERPFVYVSDVADRDPIVETFGIWFPQCEAVVYGRELLLVYVEWLLYCHDGEESSRRGGE